MLDTFSDFWRMIWQYNISGIIMLNDLKDEGEGATDYSYFPVKENESETYGLYNVHLVKKIHYPESIVRLFKLYHVSKRNNLFIRMCQFISHVVYFKKEDEVKNVRHFQFIKWADHSVPSNGRALLQFRERVNKIVVNLKKTPLVIHCR